MTDEIETIKAQIKTLAAIDVLVQTNSGTYGASEACRAIGTGDPAFADYKIYENVATGKTRRVGCDPDKAPGRDRHFREEISARRRELADLRAELKKV